MAAAAQPEPVRHLRAITDAGEVVANPEVAALEEEIEMLKLDRKMLKRDIVTKNRKISELERNKIRERLEHPDRKVIERVAAYWHRKCRAVDFARAVPKVNPMSPERFDAVAALMEMERIVVDAETGKKRRERVYSPEAFKEAIDGAFFDCFVTTRKNGTKQRHDDLELICRTSAKFDEFRARAPKPCARPVDAQ